MARKLGSGRAARVNFVRTVEWSWTTCRRRATATWHAGAMIARIWRGATKADRAQDYLEYLRGTGIADYAATPGNHGVEVCCARRATARSSR